MHRPVESPAKKWPNTIGAWPILIKYPYLLPCSIAAFIISIGAVLSLFLGWDGGPRDGAIRLTGNDSLTGRPSVPDATTQAVNALRKKVKQQVAGHFSGQAPKSGYEDGPAAATSSGAVSSGSAYGYGYGYRDRIGHSAGGGPRRRRTDENEDLVNGHFRGDDLNFAQRLLMGTHLLFLHN